MEIKEVYKNRRSVRKFKDTEIDEDIINELLFAANSAPCTDTCNYFFGVIRDSVVKHQIGEATIYANWVADAPVIFVCCSNIQFDLKNETAESYAMQGMTARYGKETVDFLIGTENRKSAKTLMQASPAYIAAQHIILSAVSMGFRGCLVDFINLEKINKILGLPDNITCELLVPIGYPDETPIPIKTNEKKNVFYDKWDK
ncbi:MAG: nitroreductase family protein [Clostridia bacterium]|nr:nitroreductase family protein [Clostridia bacterium]